MSAKNSIFTFLGVILLTVTAFASENRNLVNGAGTLSKGKKTLGFNLGLDFPGPLLYGIQFDWGVVDRFQLGFMGSTFGVLSSFGPTSTFNVYRSKNERHFLSLFFSPQAFIYIEDWSVAEIFVFLNPALIYEIRNGTGKHGFYLKTGTLSNIQVADGSVYGFDSYWNHSFTAHLGFQKSFKRAAFTFEMGIIKPLNNDFALPVGRVGWMWGLK